MKKNRVTIRVRYCETDRMGPAHHGSFLDWMEVGRTELIRETGLSYKEMEEHGFALPVGEFHCRYIRPALYDEEIIIETEIMELKKRMLKIGYTLIQASNQTVLAKGYTIHPCVDSNEGKVSRFPDFFMQKVALVMEE